MKCILEGKQEWKEPLNEIDKSLENISNPNLLDNWYFPDPINQREQMEYTNVGYTVDRWSKDQPGTMTLLNDGIQITSVQNDILNVRQEFDTPSRLAGQTITYSVLTEGSISLVLGVNGGYPISIDQDSGKNVLALTYTLPENITNLTMYIQVKRNSTIKIYAAKLELGTEQTLARQDANGNWVLNDPPPNYALELLKCRRYFERSHWNVGLAVALSSGEIRFCSTYYFNVTKRTTPSITPRAPHVGQQVMVWDPVTYSDIISLEHISPIALNTSMFSPRITDPQNRFVAGRVYQVLVPDLAYDISADL